jgi:squalene synthase HpnC
MSRRENFPVGSLLIHRDLRGVVAAFYRFARASDDVADHPGLTAEERLRQLDAFEGGLDGDPAGRPEGLALAALDRPEPARHARQLLRAFRTDARGESCATWDDLLAYCEDSANPVGRFLLDLHGEARAARPMADRLCTALQVLNHLQDLKADHRLLDRRYLPADWMAAEGASPADLARPALTSALRGAVDRALERCDGLLDGAVGACPERSPHAALLGGGSRRSSRLRRFSTALHTFVLSGRASVRAVRGTTLSCGPEGGCTVRGILFDFAPPLRAANLGRTC